MAANSNELMTELNSFVEMRKAFITFKISLKEQYDLIFTAGKVLNDAMFNDDVSVAYTEKLGEICADLSKTVESVNGAIGYIERRIAQIDEILISLKELED